MTQEEIKSRNIALAAYMGWEVTASLSDGQPFACNREDSRHMHWDSNPPFHTDMNLLMPVVWKLMKDWRYGFVLSAWGEKYCIVPMFDGTEALENGPVDESPALALWEAVSSLVMELQKKAV